MASQNSMTMPAGVARLTAAGVFLLATAGAAGAGAFAMLPLAADFAARVAGAPRLSPIASMARLLSARLFRPPRLVPSAPKRFAAAMGLATSLASAVLTVLPGMEVAGRVVAGLLAGCALLEAALGFCVGCVIHGRLARAGWLGVASCKDCTTSPQPGP